MGLRGEIFSNRVALPNRTYFFNIKENRMGDLYLNIVESKNRETGGFDRQSVILFADDLQEFLKGFDESLRVLEKAVREKRRSGKVTSKQSSGTTGDREQRGDKREPESDRSKQRVRVRTNKSNDYNSRNKDNRSDNRSENRDRGNRYENRNKERDNRNRDRDSNRSKNNRSEYKRTKE
jgi:hypothetical protein